MRKACGPPSQARELFEYTKSVGGRIAASEFMNEPTFAAMGGAPKGYDAASYGRDVAVFRSFLRKTAPDTLFLGPGSVGEGPFAIPMAGGVLKSEDLLHAAGPVFDVFSYHLYAAISQRCASMGASSQTTAAAALSQDWLSRPEKIGTFYCGPSRQVRTGQITLDYGNRRCSLRWKPLGVDFSGHLPISCSTCKPRPAWRESDYAQHTGIKRLWLVRRKYIRTTPELLGCFALATPHGYDSSRSTDSINSESLCLCALSAEPFRWRRALGHQCRRTTSP